MRNVHLLGTLALLSLPACGGGDGTSTPSMQGKTTKTPDDTVAQSTTFNPPAAADGYTRFSSKTVKDVLPGGDATYCQYVMAPTDHDIDVMDVTGVQSEIGHHAIAFAYTGDGTQEVGTILPCMGTEFSMADGTTSASNESLSIGGFLGAAGGNGQSGVKLPDGVVFRLRKGDGIMMNVHYLNTSDHPIDGDSVIDVKFAEVDPDRLIAAMFVNVNLNLNLAPNAASTASVDCVAQSDINMLMMTNHMHDYGSSATSEVIRADGGDTEMMHADPSWTFDMQFNAIYSKWSVAEPFVVHTGDTIRTTCNWTNKTPDTVTFPREMCVGVGFVLTTGQNPHAPACINGAYVAQYF
ncbi:MAG TPA: hypothetical protein VH062_15520 [Polyangiaceae bacterium]|jgi:hypothetical protein|nr:hypothetical protein [Polyangiaceae bacterium]